MTLENLETLGLLLPLERSETEYEQLIEKAKELHFDSNRKELAIQSRFQLAYEASFAVYAEDVGGDGEMDVLGAAWIVDNITYRDVTNYASEGCLESTILDVQESPEGCTLSGSALGVTLLRSAS